MKVILKGSKSCSWQLDGQFVMGGIVRDLTKKQLAEAKASDIISEFIDKEPVKKVKIYTEQELFAMVKSTQVKMIEKLGLEPASKEADRVKQILESQK